MTARYKKYHYWRPKSRHKSIGFKFFVFVCLLIACFAFIEKQLSPAISAIAAQRAHARTMICIQNAVNGRLTAYSQFQDYQNLMHIEKDSTGHIVLMMPNTIQINLLISEITLDIEEQLYSMSKETLHIPLGKATGSKILANTGPDIQVKVTPIGTSSLHVVDSFEDAGINQTRHRISLDISVDILIAAPFEKEMTKVETTVLLAEGIIVGPIPDTYLNLQF